MSFDQLTQWMDEIQHSEDVPSLLTQMFQKYDPTVDRVVIESVMLRLCYVEYWKIESATSNNNIDESGG